MESKDIKLNRKIRKTSLTAGYYFYFFASLPAGTSLVVKGIS